MRGLWPYRALDRVWGLRVGMTPSLRLPSVGRKSAEGALRGPLWLPPFLSLLGLQLWCKLEPLHS